MFNFGAFSEYSDAVTAADPVVAAVAKSINLGAWTGKFYEAMGAPDVAITSKQFDVFTRTKTPRAGVVGTGGWTASATTALPVSAGLANGITVGHVLKVGAEVVTVSKVNRTAGTIDVFARGDAGTTAASAAANDAITVIGFAGTDTDLKDVESTYENTIKYSNFVQTVFETIDWTKHGDMLRKGMQDSHASALLIREAEIRVAEILATMAVNGYRKDGGANKRYMSAGLVQQLTDTMGGTRPVLTYDVKGELTEAKMLDALKAVYAAGGNADTIWCNPTCKSYINAFNIANSGIALNASRDSHTAGDYVNYIDFEGKVLAVRVDSAIPAGNIAVVNQSMCRKGWLEDDGLRLVDEPAPSSREHRKSLQGSVGFAIEGVGTEHILLTGITGGKTERVYKTVNAG